LDERPTVPLDRDDPRLFVRETPDERLLLPLLRETPDDRVERVDVDRPVFVREEVERPTLDRVVRVELVRPTSERVVRPEVRDTSRPEDGRDPMADDRVLRPLFTMVRPSRVDRSPFSVERVVRVPVAPLDVTVPLRPVLTTVREPRSPPRVLRVPAMPESRPPRVPRVRLVSALRAMVEPRGWYAPLATRTPPSMPRPYQA